LHRAPKLTYIGIPLRTNSSSTSLGCAAYGKFPTYKRSGSMVLSNRALNESLGVEVAHELFYI
jgi:hypothetical protein